MDTRHYIFVKITECAIPVVNPNVNQGLWMIMCQCRFISCEKCNILLWDVDSGGGCGCVGAGGMWVLPFQTVLKIKCINNKNSARVKRTPNMSFMIK